jgi:hypothetical protein
MMNDDAWKNLRVGLAGALAGGVVGYFAFSWALGQGFYAPVLPGGMVGIGGGLLVKDRSVLRATVCGLLALGLGGFAEWRLRPFIADHSLGYFLTHLHQLSPLTLVAVIGGGVLGYWLALGKAR